MSGPARIGLIGASWRAQYSLRIAQALPHLFEITGVLVASESSAQKVSEQWSIPTTTDRARFIALGPYDFVIVCVPREASAKLTSEMVDAGIPALIETPPAGTLEELRDLYAALGEGAPVQVAEQYAFQPSIAARLATASAGLLGDVSTVRASFAHGYHAINVMRRALGSGFEPVQVRASVIADPQVAVRGRDGWLDEPVAVTGERTIALLEWHNVTAIYDFAGDQYVSPLRRRCIELTGDRGELRNDEIVYLHANGHVTEQSITRRSTGIDGDLDGFHLESIALGERLLWRNPFAPARLNDDEIAVAEVLRRMTEFVRQGTSFSSLADACHDHYLGLLIDEAARTGTSILSERQPWADARSDTTGDSA